MKKNRGTKISTFENTILHIGDRISAAKWVSDGNGNPVLKWDDFTIESFPIDPTYFAYKKLNT
jgi:hypothetical protein